MDIPPIAYLMNQLFFVICTYFVVPLLTKWYTGYNAELLNSPQGTMLHYHFPYSLESNAKRLIAEKQWGSMLPCKHSVGALWSPVWW